jgi:hypothetical protein
MLRSRSTQACKGPCAGGAVTQTQCCDEPPGDDRLFTLKQSFGSKVEAGLAFAAKTFAYAELAAKVRGLVDMQLHRCAARRTGIICSKLGLI